ncbi:hypothetical protein HNQ64_002972 [Prosthecobacter dejongeii]|uniref:Uncharacterized protein n=1 Tax=Prosthecobacter dejongeii TaxID=48465 RepID=A0A7W7YM86_9BACT|nr:hypothetical protein [Prosthecobacter dejongeii]
MPAVSPGPPTSKRCNRPFSRPSGARRVWTRFWLGGGPGVLGAAHLHPRLLFFRPSGAGGGGGRGLAGADGITRRVMDTVPAPRRGERKVAGGGARLGEREPPDGWDNQRCGQWCALEGREKGRFTPRCTPGMLDRAYAAGILPGCDLGWGDVFAPPGVRSSRRRDSLYPWLSAGMPPASGDGADGGMRSSAAVQYPSLSE